jgi:hypothetical protein
VLYSDSLYIFLSLNKQTKSPLDETDGDDFLSEGPPPMEKGSKKKKNTVSLFDDEEGADWTDPIYIPSKTATINTLKVCLGLFIHSTYNSCVRASVCICV